jgi:hypothetical protein
MSAAARAPLVAVARGHTKFELPSSADDVEAASNPPSNTSSISGVDPAQNVPVAVSSDAEKDPGPANGNSNGILHIDKLAFKREPRVARGPYYSTQVE